MKTQSLDYVKQRAVEWTTRYVSHICLILCLLAVIVTIFNISSQGYVPYDDCLRHCAKAVSGNPWEEILVVRPEYHDHNAGWHHILEWVHRHVDADVSELIGFSVISLFLCATLPVLFRFGRPEAWLLAILSFGLLFFGSFFRFFYGRPFIFATGGTILILDLWTRNVTRRSYGLMVFTTLLFALMTYIHGSFYVYIIPVGVFLLAGQWKKFLRLMPCLLAGIAVGICLTGEPVAFINSQLLHLNMITLDPIEARYLVSEFKPFPILSALILPVSVFLILRYLRIKTVAPLWKDPVFLLLISMGILAFHNARFWLDFGIPAFLVWTAREIERLFEIYLSGNDVRRILFTVGICGAFFLIMTTNLDDRWDNNYEGCGRYFPKADDPELAGWFPEKNGIFYNLDMTFFYNTFAANPHADWRYMLGFEPDIMPQEDLEIYRGIQRKDPSNPVQRWINKMRPQDRMAVQASARPPAEELEWKEVFPNLWFGRLPGTVSTNQLDPR